MAEFKRQRLAARCSVKSLAVGKCETSYSTGGIKPLEFEAFISGYESEGSDAHVKHSLLLSESEAIAIHSALSKAIARWNQNRGETA